MSAPLCMWNGSPAGPARRKARLSRRAGGALAESCGLGSKSRILGSG